MNIVCIKMTDCIPDDIILLIASYHPIPAILRRVSTSWRDKIDSYTNDTISALRRKYSGVMRTLDGESYSTIYTCLRQAIRDNNVGIVSILCTWTGYLPIPWNLYVYDIEKGYHHHTLITSILKRCTLSGKACYDLLLNGWNMKSSLPLSVYSPYIHCNDNEKLVINKPIRHLREFNDECIPCCMGIIKENGYPLTRQHYLDMIEGVQDRLEDNDISRTEMSYIRDNIGGYFHLHDMDDPDIMILRKKWRASQISTSEIGMYLNGYMDGDDVEDIIEYIEIDHDKYRNNISISTEEMRLYPIAPLYCSFEDAILFDRPDILIEEYAEEEHLQRHILSITEKDIIDMGPYVKELIRMLTWNVFHEDQSLYNKLIDGEFNHIGLPSRYYS